LEGDGEAQSGDHRGGSKNPRWSRIQAFEEKLENPYPFLHGRGRVTSSINSLVFIIKVRRYPSMQCEMAKSLRCACGLAKSPAFPALDAHHAQQKSVHYAPGVQKGEF
jgi:hypothetical protein